MARARRLAFEARLFMTVLISCSVAGALVTLVKDCFALRVRSQSLCAVTQNTHPLATCQRLGRCSSFSDRGVPKARGDYLQGASIWGSSGSGSRRFVVRRVSRVWSCLSPTPSPASRGSTVLAVATGAPCPRVLCWSEHSLQQSVILGSQNLRVCSHCLLFSAAYLGIHRLWAL